MADDHTVIGRAVAILDCVVDASAPVPLAVLAHCTGVPKSTVRRIANDLAARGLLEHTAAGYLPGAHLVRHGLVLTQQYGLATVAQPYLQDLHVQTRGQAAWLSVVHSGEMILAGAVFGHRHASDWARSRFPRMSTFGPSAVLLAAGRIDLAHRPASADQILRTGWQPMTRYSVTSRTQMRQILAEVYETGIASEIEQAQLGSSCLAASLRDSSGGLIGAVGVTGRSGEIAARGVRGALTRTAQMLTRELLAQPASAASVSWNVPTFDHRLDVGQTWPEISER